MFDTFVKGLSLSTIFNSHSLASVIVLFFSFTRKLNARRKESELHNDVREKALYSSGFGDQKCIHVLETTCRIPQDAMVP